MNERIESLQINSASDLLLSRMTQLLWDLLLLIKVENPKIWQCHFVFV